MANMLKSIREKLCCGKADTVDGHESPSRPVEIPHKTSNELEAPTPTPSSVKPNEAIVEKPAKRDLWKEAFDSLPDDRKQYLTVNEGCSTVDAIDNVINTTEQKYKEWKHGGLKIRRRDGKDFNVRDSVEKILNCAMNAKVLVSTAVSFDRTGYASAAWAIVSLGLTMIQNNIQRRDAVFAASEYLADTLAYYTLIDTHHRNQHVDSDQNLDNALLGVYTALLEYSAEVNKVQKQNAAVRVAMSINAIADQPLEQLKATVKEKGQGADKWAHLSDMLRNREIAEKILAKIDMSIIANKNIETKVLTAEDERILKWVSTADYSQIQNETQELRSSNTGDWFLTSKRYQDWKDLPGHILWLYGIVGCGKTVLCSTIIQDIKRLCEEDSSKSVAYWYFQFSNDMTRSVENLARSLIRQFSRKPLAQSITRMWENHSEPGSQPGREELLNTLHDVLLSTPGEMFLVLDALDECPERSARNERKTLLSLLLGLNERHGDKLHILATSRPEQDIRATLERFPTVDLEAQLAEDVETFVRAEVSTGRLRDLEEDKRVRTLERLLRTRDRRFRWADLQITRLADCHTDQQIDHALRTIPETLEETYREVLDRIEEKDISIARNILLLLCLAPVPLDVRTIAEAVSLRSPDFIVKICTTSLVIVSTDGAIRLAHFSVKEYLVVSENVENDHRCRFSEIKGHHELAVKTIDLLLSQNETLTEEVAMSQSFLVYAARAWDSHVDAAGEVLDIQGEIDRLFCEPITYFNWVRIFESRHSIFDNPWLQVPEECEPPIYRASAMGLAHTVETLFAQGSDPLEPSVRSGSENALIVAAECGHLDIVEFLLDKNLTIAKKWIRILMNCIDYPHGRKEKLEAILNLVWDMGLLFDKSKIPEKIVEEDIIECAMMNRRCGFELTKLLLDRRHEAGIPITDNVLRCALEDSTFSEEILRLLFERCNEDIHIGPSFFAELDRINSLFPQNYYSGIDIILMKRATELPVDDYSVAFWASHASSKAMDFVLQTRADIRITEQTLSAAASNIRGADMIRLLIDRREPGTQISETILLAAAENEQGQEILRFLIDELDPAAAMTERMILNVAEKIDNGETLKVLIEGLSSNTPLTEKVIKNLIMNGPAMVRLVLDRQQAGFVVSERIIQTAASCKYDPVELLQLLMVNGGAELPITEFIVCAAAANKDHGSSVMEFLFRVQEDCLTITENVLNAAASNPPALGTILNKCPEVTITDAVFEAACREKDAMLMLLSRPHNCLPIKRMMAKIAESEYQTEVLKLLVDRHLVEVDAWAVETVACTYRQLKFLLSRKPDVPITHQALIRATEDLDSVRLLLETEKNHSLVTEEVMMAATRSFPSSHKMKSILCRVESAPITRNVLKEAMFHIEVDAVKFILSERPDLDLKASWEEIWQDVDLDRPGEKKARATVVISRLPDFEVTESILQSYPYDWESKIDYGFDDMLMWLDLYGVPIPATEGVGMVVLERCSNAVAETFLMNYPNIPITDKLFQAVERNPRADREGLLSLLARIRDGVVERMHQQYDHNRIYV